MNQTRYRSGSQPGGLGYVGLIALFCLLGCSEAPDAADIEIEVGEDGSGEVGEDASDDLPVDGQRDAEPIPTTLISATRGGVVHSQNTRLTIDFAPGVLDADLEVGIEVVLETDWPEGITDPVSAVYRVLPVDALLLADARATFWLSSDESERLTEADIHRIAAITRGPSGSERLNGPTITWQDDSQQTFISDDLRQFGILYVTDQSSQLGPPTGLVIDTALESGRGETSWSVAPRFGNESVQTVRITEVELTATAMLRIIEGESVSGGDGRETSNAMRTGDLFGDTDELNEGQSNTIDEPFEVLCIGEGAAEMTLRVLAATATGQAEFTTRRTFICP